MLRHALVDELVLANLYSFDFRLIDAMKRRPPSLVSPSGSNPLQLRRQFERNIFLNSVEIHELDIAQFA